jgi:hypothetical protein
MFLFFSVGAVNLPILGRSISYIATRLRVIFNLSDSLCSTAHSRGMLFRPSRCLLILRTVYAKPISFFLSANRLYQCIMITGDNPLTAAHVARDVEIVDRDVLILDLKENPEHDAGKISSTLLSQCAALIFRNNKILYGALLTKAKLFPLIHQNLWIFRSSTNTIFVSRVLRLSSLRTSLVGMTLFKTLGFTLVFRPYRRNTF